MPASPHGKKNNDYNAVIISHYGNELLIQDIQGERFRAVTRQNLPPLAPGDRVRYEPGDTGLAVICDVTERHGILSRHSKHQDRLIAVNIDTVCIVCAAKPALKTGLIDRYLTACELAGLSAHIIYNKIDMHDSATRGQYRQMLSVYLEIGYPVSYVSAKSGEGIVELRDTLSTVTSVLVGQSGVGKSSLIKALMPDTSPKIGRVSHASSKGRHTTTHSELYQLGENGFIIDSPGIREFGIQPASAQALAYGFREFVPYLDQCRFRDCSHHAEPGCAVIQAAEDGKIRPERLDSYRNIIASFSRTQ